MISCEDEKKHVQSIIASNVTDFIVKPFSLNTLERKIEQIEKTSRPEINII